MLVKTKDCSLQYYFGRKKKSKKSCYLIAGKWVRIFCYNHWMGHYAAIRNHAVDLTDTEQTGFIR